MTDDAQGTSVAWPSADELAKHFHPRPRNCDVAKDWELARKDAAKAIDVLRAAVAPVKEGNADQKDMLERISGRISTRLNDWLCEMKPGYDDSIVGFNEAWDIVRAVFKDELSRVTEGVRGEPSPPVKAERHPGPFIGPDVELARACAVVTIADYGNDTPEEHQRIMDGGIWNDHIAVQTALTAIHSIRKAALTAARDTEGKEPEAYRETVRRVAAAREKRLADLKGALERLANPEPMAFLQSLEADARIEFARSVLAPVSSTQRGTDNA